MILKYLNSFSSLHVFRPISDNFTYHCEKFLDSFKVRPQLETCVLFIVKKESKKTYNRGQNLWNNVKKSSKIGQDKKTLESVFA